MTRYAIDAAVALRLIDDDVAVPSEHSLVGPARLRSDVLDLLLASERAGERDERRCLLLLDRLAALRIRLLADRVSRRTAWRIARDLGHDGVARAEYLAVAKLQADVLVTLDDEVRRDAEGVVALASVSVLLG